MLKVAPGIPFRSPFGGPCPLRSQVSPKSTTLVRYHPVPPLHCGCHLPDSPPGQAHRVANKPTALHPPPASLPCFLAGSRLIVLLRKSPVSCVWGRASV